MFRYAREDAMSKLGGAIADGAQLIDQLYLSFYQELQKPLLAGSATTAGKGSDTHTHEQTGQAADSAARNGAVAKVARFPNMTQNLDLFVMICPQLCFSCLLFFPYTCSLGLVISCPSV